MVEYQYNLTMPLIGFIVSYFYTRMSDGFLVPRFIRKYMRIYSACVLSILVSVMNITLVSTYRMVLSILIYIVFSLFFYKGKIYMKLLPIGLHMFMLTAAEIIVIPLLGTFGYPVAVYFNNFSYRHIMDISVAGVYVLLYFLIREVVFLIENQIDNRAWRQLGYCLFTLLFTVLVVFMPVAMRPAEGERVEGNPFLDFFVGDFAHIFSMLLLMGLFIAIGSLVRNMNDSMKREQQAVLSTQKLHFELSQSMLRAKHTENVRVIQHDMKNHLLAIDALATAGETARQHAYIQGLLASLITDKAEHSCGNIVIDSMVSSKRIIMDEKHIASQWQVQDGIPEHLGIDDIKICTLLSNALDNALEACLRLPEEAKRSAVIDVKIKYDASGLFVRIQNPCKDVKAAIRDAFRLSSKRVNAPGFGMRAIRRTVNETGGELSIAQSDNGQFMLTAYLPNAEHGANAGGA